MLYQWLYKWLYQCVNHLNNINKGDKLLQVGLNFFQLCLNYRVIRLNNRQRACNDDLINLSIYYLLLYYLI